MADSITSLMFKLYSISSYVYTSCHILIFPPLTTSLRFYFNSLIKCCQMMKRALIKWYAKYLLTKADYRCENNAHKMISDVSLINQCITIISYAMYICSYFSLWQLHSYIRSYDIHSTKTISNTQMQLVVCRIRVLYIVLTNLPWHRELEGLHDWSG